MYFKVKSHNKYHNGKKISKYDKALRIMQKERISREEIIQLPNGDFKKIINTS